MARLNARAGIARAAASRAGDFWPKGAVVSVGGTARTTSIDTDSIIVTDLLNEQANTATFRCWDFTPTYGQEVLIGVGSLDNRLFGGRIQRVTQLVRARHIDRPEFDVYCVDWTWDLDKRLVLESYGSQDVASILYDILTTYASGFTMGHTPTGLGNVAMDFTRETVSGAITRLANAVGANWYIDPWKDLHFYTTTESLESTPQTMTASAAESTHEWRHFSHTVDYSQIRTRTYVEGERTTTVAAVTGVQSLPVVDLMGLGSVDPYRVGATLTSSAGTGSLAAGAYSTRVNGQPLTYIYNYDFATTSFVGSNHGGYAASAWGPLGDQASWEVDDAVYLGSGWVWQDCVFLNTVKAVWDIVITWEYWNGSTWAALAPDAAPDFTVLGEQWLTFQPPSNWATTTVNSVAGQYWIRGRITTATATTSVGSVSAAWTDVLPGDAAFYTQASLTLAGNKTWVQADDGQAIYIGTVGNAIQYSVPTSGPGAITAPLRYGASLVTLNCLRQGTILPTLPAGTDVVIAVTVNDSAAQTALASAEGGDGIREHAMSDGRLSLAGATDRGDAELTLFADPLTSIRFQTRDPAVRSGRSVTVNLTSPTSVSGTFLIQRVETTFGADEQGKLYDAPWKTVEASSVRFDFYDVLRRLERGERLGA